MAMGLFRLMVHCSLLLLLSARTVPHSTRDELFRFSLAGQRSTTTSRRDTPGGQEGGGAFEFASGNFSSLVKSTAANHNGPLLIHSEGKHTGITDTLTFIRKGNVAFTVPLSIPHYSSLSAVSHLPVSAVTALIPELGSPRTPATLTTDSREKLQVLQLVLEETSQLLQGGVFEDGVQSARQSRISNATMEFISGILDGTEAVTRAVMQTFAQSVTSDLQANAMDGVRDYLTCLNATITGLLTSGNITEEEWQAVTVAIPVNPFTRSINFVVQYYQRLLGDPSNSRVMALPIARSQSLYYPNVSLAQDLQDYALSTLVEELIQVFSDSTTTLSTPHDFLTSAASEVICNELFESSCSESNNTTDSGSAAESGKLPAGFETQVERVYVIVIIYGGTLSTILVIVLSCICLEGRKMKLERRSEEEILKGPNVFTPIEAGPQPTESDGLEHQGTDQSESLVSGPAESDRNSVRTVESLLSLESETGLGSTVTHTEVAL